MPIKRSSPFPCLSKKVEISYYYVLLDIACYAKMFDMGCFKSILKHIE